MAKFLVHVHTGPENPTKAALGCLVAATAAKEGHEVSLFLAGDGVLLLDEVAPAVWQNWPSNCTDGGRAGPHSLTAAGPPLHPTRDLSAMAEVRSDHLPAEHESL